jgi:large subunit ribosomal protein L23
MLIRPLINEKSMGLTRSGFFSFEVSKNSTKSVVEKLVKDKFNVHVLSVKIINVKGKTKTQPARRGYYQTSGMKKAIVQLKKGEKIALFEVASPDEEEVEIKTAEGEVIAKTKQKKSLLRGTKVKVENIKDEEKNAHPAPNKHTGKMGKTKGESN